MKLHTKIIATLGPASREEKVLKKMFAAGMDVARLNFSHGNWEVHQSLLDMVRRLNRKLDRTVKILQDLEGPRIRIGKLKNGQPLKLKKRCFVSLTKDSVPGDSNRLPLDYRGTFLGVKKGQAVYIDDGNILLHVHEVHKGNLLAEVIVGGVVKEKKGVNMPGAALHFEPLTKKDKKDIGFAVRNQVDFLALSFVRSKNDLLILKKFLGKRIPGLRLIAKIENREAIQNMDDIIAEADGVMIARGDMGVSLPIFEVPVMQKRIIKRCKEQGKFVIIATQMLESMIEHFRPTRAEVSDVANAVFDGTDYVMLSAETASGQYPVETVTMMNQILKFTERSIPELN